MLGGPVSINVAFYPGAHSGCIVALEEPLALEAGNNGTHKSNATN